MKRVMLLTLLAVALPTAALANTINLSTGTFSSGIIGVCTGGCHELGPGFTLTLTGANGTLTISGSTLSPNPCSSGTCTFSGGMATFRNTGGTLEFSDGINSGSFTKTSGDRIITSVTGSFVDGGTLSLLANITWVGGGDLRAGNMQITLPTQVPESGSALELLGTGAIGLAAMMWRKLALWM